jgi:hypothetical protein
VLSELSALKWVPLGSELAREAQVGIPCDPVPCPFLL